MKKAFASLMVVTSLMSFGIACAFADEACSVMGIRQPNTNNYFGPTQCGAIFLSYLTVKGPLTLSGTHVNGTTDVSGPISANRATLKNILIRKQIKSVTVDLTTTQVNGDITFEGNAGKVIVHQSTISGKVNNGKIIKQ